MFFISPELAPCIINVVVKRKDMIEVTLVEPNVALFKEQFLAFFVFLRDSEEFQLKSLMDLFVVDLLEKTTFLHYRFLVIYNLLSVKKNFRVSVKLLLKSKMAWETLSSVFLSANFLEREVWDMYGVFFYNHPDLRRILTDYGFSGHPLRKDFPLTGFVELRFDDVLKRVVFDKLEVSQEFRMFEFLSPWENRR